MTTRTFSVSTRPASPQFHDLLGETIVTINADPTETLQPDGRKKTSMGFPILHVSGWVADPEKFAARLAALLAEYEI